MDSLTRLQAAIGQAKPVIAAIDVDDYDKPTPCEGWDVRAVINHMIGALTMFRDVGTSGSADPSLFARDLIGNDAVSSFDAAAAEALAAWSMPGKMDGVANLPFGEFPAQFALQLPAMDMVVHSWDIAKATGADVDWDAALIEETSGFVTSTFTSSEFRGHDFKEPVPLSDDADDVSKLVAFLGRQP